MPKNTVLRLVGLSVGYSSLFVYSFFDANKNTPKALEAILERQAQAQAQTPLLSETQAKGPKS